MRLFLCGSISSQVSLVSCSPSLTRATHGHGRETSDARECTLTVALLRPRKRLSDWQPAARRLGPALCRLPTLCPLLPRSQPITLCMSQDSCVHMSVGGSSQGRNGCFHWLRSVVAAPSSDRQKHCGTSGSTYLLHARLGARQFQADW